jgi:hypothetical protein
MNKDEVVSEFRTRKRLKDYCLINLRTQCQYMFRPYSNSVKVLIDDGHGWRTYDSAMVAGNYETHQARIFWHSLVKQGFTINTTRSGSHTGFTPLKSQKRMMQE